MSSPPESLLSRIASLNEKTSVLIEQIRGFITNKLYHELTVTLIELFGIPELSCDDKLLLFENVIHPIKNNLNILKFAQLLRMCSENLEPSASLEQLSKYTDFLSTDLPASLMLKITKSHHHTRNSDYEESAEILRSIHSEIEESFGLDLTVISAYYITSASLNKVTKNYDRWYEDTLMHLCYTPVSSISPQERDELAIDFAISSIAAPNNYNFGAVLTQPIINTCLKQNSRHGWLYLLVVALNDGDFAQYDEIVSKHKGSISHSGLGQHWEQLQRKITLMALINLVFTKSKKQRTITFEEISKECRIALDEVELLLIKAMSNEVIKGKINQVEQVVTITWVQSRIIDSTKITPLLDGVNWWNQQLKELIDKLKDITPELLVS